MRTTLLDDDEELRAIGCDYLGDGDDFGEGFGPMGAAFVEVDEALHNLTVNSPEAATAVHFAWQADDELGLAGSWDPRLVAKARKLAMTTLPKPR